MDVKKIKNKFKQCKYQHLKKIYTKHLSRLPENCKYNKAIRLSDRSRSSFNICAFNLEDSYDVDLCYRSDHAKECNAFCVRKSKEKIYTDFLDELKDDQVRATKYKDINTLYWMCPELKLDDFPEKRRWFHKITRFF